MHFKHFILGTFSHSNILHFFLLKKATFLLGDTNRHKLTHLSTVCYS